jgi:hypothetical protein
MSTIPAKESEPNRDEPDRRGHVLPLRQTCHGKDRLQRRLGSRQMRGKLCARRPYTPRDLAGRYASEGVLHVRTTCDGRIHLCAPPAYGPHPTDTVFRFALGGAT